MLDPDPGGLEHRPVCGDGEDQPLGRPLLCAPHDIRQLRPLQLAGGHLGGGILKTR